VPLQYDRYIIRVECVTGARRTFQLVDPYEPHPGPGTNIWWNNGYYNCVFAGSGKTWKAAAANAARILRRLYGPHSTITIEPTSYFTNDSGG
jgi:hypothetical protein